MSHTQALVAGDAGIRIASAADIADALGACFGTAGLILTEADLDPRFFDLRTGLLGELMQKFVNYRIRLALVVLQPEDHGPRFVELTREHRTHSLIRILPSLAECRAWLAH